MGQAHGLGRQSGTNISRQYTEREAQVRNVSTYSSRGTCKEWLACVLSDATKARCYAMRFAELQTYHSAHRSRDRTEGCRLARRTAWVQLARRASFVGCDLGADP